MAEAIHHIYKDHEGVQFLIGKKDTLLLNYESYLYKRVNGGFPRTKWSCSSGCSASVHTFNGIFEKATQVNSHTHPPPIDEIAVFKTMMKIKARVQSEYNLTPRQIHTEERVRLMLRNESTAHLQLDSFAVSKSKWYKHRRATFPKAPQHRKDILLSGNWTLTLDKSEKFLLVDDGMEDRILIFATESNLRILCDANYVISDGTFSVQPNIFSQFYVFHAPYLGKVMPLVFCLLPDKSYNTYSRLLVLIKNAAVSIGASFSPRKMHIDYESAMIKAIGNVFSENCIQGCLFHFSQCIWRKVQDLGFAQSYKRFEHVRRWIRRFSALPLLPIDDIDNGYLAIQESAPDPSNETITAQQIKNFHDYMVETWVDDSDAKFSRVIWSQFENDGPRTTNNAEGWHNKLNKDAKSRHSFFQFIHFLQSVQVDIDATKFDLISESPSRRSKYRNVDDSLQVAKQNYLTGSVSILNYLDSVSIALKLD